MRLDVHRRAGLFRDSVFAAHDGIITTYAIIAGAKGASLPSFVIVILSLVNLLADGISMASGNYLGIESEQDYEKAEGENLGKKDVPLFHGMITFFAFSFIGFLPLIPYVIGIEARFMVSSAIVIVSLFTIGASRSKLTKKGWLRSGLEMLFVGGIAAFVAYAVGFLSDKFLF